MTAAADVFEGESAEDIHERLDRYLGVVEGRVSEAFMFTVGEALSAFDVGGRDPWAVAHEWRESFYRDRGRAVPLLRRSPSVE